MRVLLVEDNVVLNEIIQRALESSGLQVDRVFDGISADLALKSSDYVLAVIDVGLPRLDGFALLSRLRARHQQLPVLMLTARSDVHDRVRGLNLGADDYLAKPFELSELEARVNALLRRSLTAGSHYQCCGELHYEIHQRRFSLGGAALTLTAREQAVLESLIARPGRMLSKQQLATQIFSLDHDTRPQAIEIYIHRLRKKLKGSGVHIVTFRGLGYLLEAIPA